MSAIILVARQIYGKFSKFGPLRAVILDKGTFFLLDYIKHEGLSNLLD